MILDEFLDNTEEVVEEEIIFTEEQISEMTDKFFPIRNCDNKPMYRKYQRETIINICKSFLIDKIDYIGVEGPVGCGKSVINYTVARIIGKTVYLTPFKMLQDQIISEDWEGVRMIKGRGAYACNHCGYDDNKIRCDYSGDEFKTCQNSKTLNKYSSSTLIKIKERLALLFSKASAFDLRLRTSFKSVKDFLSLIPSMKEFVSGMSKFLSEDEHALERTISCSMGDDHECPVKSSRLLAKMAPVKVLNPDIFFLLNINTNEYYGSNDLLVYDECQQIENVMNRIFQIKIPIETIRDMFGLDMVPLYELDEFDGLLNQTLSCVKDLIGPSVYSSKIISSLGDVCSVKNFPTLQRMKTQNNFALKLIECSNDFLRKKWRDDRSWEFSIIEIINYAFTDKELPEDFKSFKDFVEMIKNHFYDSCEKYTYCKNFDLYKNIIPAFYRAFNTDEINRIRKHRTRDLNLSEKKDQIEFDNIMIPADRLLADYIILMKNVLEPFVTSINNLSYIGDNEKPAFVISRTKELTRKVCMGTPLQKEVMDDRRYEGKIEKCLEIVPIAINKLMSRIFYSKAKKVLLTSGTWVCPDSLFKLYGFPKDKSKLIKIPSTFPTKNRPIYVIDDRGFTNFSEKLDEPGLSYIYKTYDGTRKFTLELSSIIKRVRRYIADNHQENANVIVHCHTFDIAKKIAEFAPTVDDSYLIHMPQIGSHIQNEITGHVVWSKSKDELIQIIKSRPNSGLTIISPSISEGVDFKNKMARAQIILKRPVPYLGDVYVRSCYRGNPDVGVERDPYYLDRVCYTTMIQQYGRIVRSEDDWGITIIIDQSITSSIKSILKERGIIGELNIGYFTDGIQYEYKNRQIIFSWPFG